MGMDDIAFDSVQGRTFHLIRNSFAETYCKTNEFAYDYKLAPELLKILYALVQAKKKTQENM